MRDQFQVQISMGCRTHQVTLLNLLTEKDSTHCIDCGIITRLKQKPRHRPSRPDKRPSRTQAVVLPGSNPLWLPGPLLSTFAARTPHLPLLPTWTTHLITTQNSLPKSLIMLTGHQVELAMKHRDFYPSEAKYLKSSEKATV